MLIDFFRNNFERIKSCQLKIELNNSETKDCFVNGAKIRDSIVIEPGVKLKRRRFSLNRGQLLNVRHSGGKLKLAKSVRKKRCRC